MMAAPLCVNDVFSLFGEVLYLADIPFHVIIVFSFGFENGVIIPIFRLIISTVLKEDMPLDNHIQSENALKRLSS